MNPRTTLDVIALALAVTVGAGVLAGCSSGPERSVQAFCSTMDEHEQAYLDQMAAAQGEGLAGIFTATSAIGDLERMWADLADVAPADVQGDVEAVRDAWRKQEDAAADGDWQASVVTGLLNAGPMGRVDAYVRENCDAGGGSAAAGPVDAAPEPEATVSAAPTLDLAPGEGWRAVRDVLLDGRTEPNGAVGPVEVFTPLTGPVSIDAASLLPGEVVSQVWELTGAPGQSYFTGLVVTRHAADGLTPEHWVGTVAAVDFREGAPSIVRTQDVIDADCDPSSYRVAFHGDDTDTVLLSHTVVGGSCSDDEWSTVALDPLTGETLWTRAGRVASATPGSALFFDPAPGYDNDGNPCETAVGVVPTTGQELFSYVTEGRTENGPCESVTLTDDGGGAWGTDHGAFWRLSTEYAVEGAAAAFDARTGAVVPLTEQPFDAWDPGSRLGVTTSDTGLDVIDPATGASVFAISRDDYDRLGIRLRSIVNGQVYLESTDQEMQIDALTGQVVSTTATPYPVGVVDDYAYLSDGTLVPLADIHA